MKKNKLSLDTFKVQSFVTSLTNPLAGTAKGGNGCDTVDQCSLGAHLCEEDSICACDTQEGQCNSGLGPGCNITNAGCGSGFQCSLSC